MSRRHAVGESESGTLSAYLRKIAKLPRLTVEEERDLGFRIQRDRDQAALSRLVESNLRFVVSFAKRYRGLGLYPMLLAEWHRQLQGTPYQRAEFSWVLEDNRDINQPAEMAGARRYKTYRIYQKALP